MPVDPAIVTWQEPVERFEQVDVGAGTELDDDEPRRRVRDEHAEEPVAFAFDEARAGRREVGESRFGAGSDGEFGRLHPGFSWSEHMQRALPLGQATVSWTLTG